MHDFSSQIITFYPLKSIPLESHVVALHQHHLKILTIISNATFRTYIGIFCLTVVSLCILLNPHHLSLHIVTFCPLELASQENYFPHLNSRNLPSPIGMFYTFKSILHKSPPGIEDIPSSHPQVHGRQCFSARYLPCCPN
jgi:hypothetical protein